MSLIKWIRLGALVGLCAGLLSCNYTTVGQKYSFDPKKQASVGLIVFGVDSPETAAYHVGRYNPENGTVAAELSGLSYSKYSLHEGGDGTKFYVLELVPGLWAFNSRERYGATYCLSSGTVQFEVKPGKLTYVGDYRLKDVEVTQDVIDKINAAKGPKEEPVTKESLLFAYKTVHDGFSDDEIVAQALRETYPKLGLTHERAELTEIKFPNLNNRTCGGMRARFKETS